MQKLHRFLLPITAFFISSASFILIFSLFVDDNCPKNNPNCGKDFRMEKRIQNLYPIIFSYSFLFIGLLFWYFLYYGRRMIDDQNADPNDQNVQDDQNIDNQITNNQTGT